MLGARVWASFGKYLQGYETISVNPGRGNIKMNSRGTTGEPVVALMPLSTTGYVLCSLTSLL